MTAISTLDGITSHIVNTPRLAIHALSSGAADGIPVLFIHGNVSSATFWEETMLALPTGYRGVAPDMRGYGDTEAKAIDATLGLDDMVEDIHALVQALGLSKLHIVGHSMGGGIVMKYAIAHPAALLSITLVDTLSPYGYGGSKGEDGAMTYDDGAPSGVNPEFVQLLAAGEAGLDNPMSPRNVFRQFYVKPPFVPAREDALIASMLTTKIGDDWYPGTAVPSPNWPGAAPGDRGVLPAFNRKYFNASALPAIDPKPPILWIRGDSDLIVGDMAMFDLAALGAIGAVPGYPGAEDCPPQPMLAQTRAVLEQYAANGGHYEEVVIADAGHSPFLEKPAEFNAAFHKVLLA
ncbi:MAG: alpha/beta hydrolase [Anaerolinea sp.]|nr:alpha/beta hydrolase [Anaerolinea sp.]